MTVNKGKSRNPGTNKGNVHTCPYRCYGGIRRLLPFILYSKTSSCLGTAGCPFFSILYRKTSKKLGTTASLSARGTWLKNKGALSIIPPGRGDELRKSFNHPAGPGRKIKEPFQSSRGAEATNKRKLFNHPAGPGRRIKEPFQSSRGAGATNKENRSTIPRNRVEE